MCYPEIVRECAAAMRAVMPENVVHVQHVVRDNAVEVGCSSKAWPCLIPQHGKGPKHLRRIVLVEWQQRIVDATPESLLRGLIHSDGCRCINKSMGRTYIRYFFDQKSSDIQEIFCRACDQLEIVWRRPKEHTISVARREGVELLDAFIGPKT